MNQHPYLRAYMAGITIPTIFLLVGITAFAIARYSCDVPLPIERVIVFPLAVVPNAWGLWNILYIAFARRRVPIGIFGALLPFLLVPAGYALTRAVDFPIPHFIKVGFPFIFPLVLAIYYLVWKYLVASLNRIVSIE